jgi:hypothetical protein
MASSTEDDYLPTKLTPSQAMLLCDILDPDRFVKYVNKDYIPYNLDQDEIFFTEENVIQFLCGDWPEEKQPEALEELEEYCDLRHDWQRIKDKAENFEVNKKLYKKLFGTLPSEADGENADEITKICHICGEDVFSKKLCEQHYHKVRYHYDEVTFKNIKKYEKQHTDSETAWSSDYDSCRGCGTTDRKHHAKGFCKRCYYRESNQ